MNYLHTIRLKKVHGNFLATKERIGVTEIATRWGLYCWGACLYKKIVMGSRRRRHCGKTVHINEIKPANWHHWINKKGARESPLCHKLPADKVGII
ncbi:MAG: hypothetical protein CMI14_11605 [Oleispira sp.]|nr:hypothetical protein [Oleispira sp.]